MNVFNDDQEAVQIQVDMLTDSLVTHEAMEDIFTEAVESLQIGSYVVKQSVVAN